MPQTPVIRKSVVAPEIKEKKKKEIRLERFEGVFYLKMLNYRKAKE